MSTAQEIINRSLRLLGTLSSGDSPTSNESSDGLTALNAMISSWLADRDMGVVTLIEYASLSTSQSLPSGYEQALVYNLAVTLAPEYQKQAPPEVVEVAKQSRAFIRRDVADAITDTAENVITKALRLIGAVGLDESPTAKELTYSLSSLNDMIGSWLANRDLGIVTLIAYSSSSTVQTLPNGYYEALVYNLAARLAPAYGKAPDPTIVDTANSALKHIRRAAAPAIAGTAQKIVNRALRLIGQIGPDEISTATESAYALDALNTMIDSWRLDRLMVYALQQESLTLSASTTSYTIGPSGNLNTTRPVRIENAQILDSGTTYDVRVIDEAEYVAIPDKTSTSSWPDRVYYAPTMTTGTLYVHPPADATRTLKLTTWVVLSSFAALSTSISLPPGYERAMVYNLALEIAPEFGKQVAPEVVSTARQTKSAIRIVNCRPIVASTELSQLFPARSGNILTGG